MPRGMIYTISRFTKNTDYGVISTDFKMSVLKTIKKIKHEIGNFGKKHEMFKRYQIILLELINKITEIKKSLNEFNSTLAIAGKKMAIL